MPNIYLVGMMGSGKTVTGKKLALLLGWMFSDLDEIIQEKARRTISEIFAKEGEEYFRDQETAVLKEVSALSPRVVATGGGSVLRPVNIERMRATGKIIYLEVSLDILWERVKGKKDRPLLSGVSPREKLERIFRIRKPLYENAADFRVSTDRETAEAVAMKIFSLREKTG